MIFPEGTPFIFSTHDMLELDVSLGYASLDLQKMKVLTREDPNFIVDGHSGKTHVLRDVNSKTPNLYCVEIYPKNPKHGLIYFIYPPSMDFSDLIAPQEKISEMRDLIQGLNN
jgi:hypothetical protein